MIHNVRAVTLWSRRSREADTVVGLFTREMGRVTARASSAARSTAKFVALTVPFVESDMALYLVPGRGWGKIVGGKILSTFPALRTQVDLKHLGVLDLRSGGAFDAGRAGKPRKI